MIDTMKSVQAHVPWGLKRFQQTRQIHFLTFSCYRRQPKFADPNACATFVSALERVRGDYRLCVYGYVVMPEHVHLLVSEPGRSTLDQAIKSLKQGIARRLALRAAASFWQARDLVLKIRSSTYRARRSLWRSCATFIAIR
jgi:putative transposase